MSPWYFLTFWAAPVRTEPVLVPFPDLAACYRHEIDRLAAWQAYVERNRQLLSQDGNEGFANWTAGPPSQIDAPDGVYFRFRAGPIVIEGRCLPGSQLSLESLKALRSSPP